MSRNSLPDSETKTATAQVDSLITDRPLTATFAELAKYRKLLQEFCSLHVPSVEAFMALGFPVFKLDHKEGEPTKFKHITSSATCFESIETCPAKFRPDKRSKDLEELGASFAATAISSPLKKWKSDGAAEIYCSCRGLPYVLLKLEKWHPNIGLHLNRIFYQMGKHGEPGRFAIGEAKEAETKKDKLREQDSWYRPNAYHTYWTLRVLRILQDKFPKEYEACKQKPTKEQQLGMRLWARQQLGIQVALHSAGSSVLDTDQLAWSLAILISQPQGYQSNLAEQDFIRQAFKCLFSTQEKVGTWRHYAPLFHYPRAGNAYWYVFETFAAVLSEALQAEAEFACTILKEYFASLVKLWEYASSTQAELVKGELAWSSGHRITPQLESWATASVFEFAQALRRLIGIWTRDEALSTLNYKSQPGTKEKAKNTVIKRADIWSTPYLAHILWSMFINPLSTPDRKEANNQTDHTPMSKHVGVSRELDPDRPLIGDEFPRSAIFFGPPGTSKTKLVSAIAEAIGWKYIELHPSHFVAEGLPNVQQIADVIFGKLRELDEAVVLFDEIDELVRERDIEPDQFGRFLTTSMLPRLAELWKARKIMYFVATNHIEYFDRAVTRSERFDAIIFVSPPSFEAKKNKIIDILGNEHQIKATFHPGITQARVDDVMRSVSCESIEKAKTKEEREAAKNQPLPSELVLAKFAMLRWDELDELALNLRSHLGTAKTITEDILKKALSDIRDIRSRSLGEYCRFLSDPRHYERFDASRKAVWIVAKIDGFSGGEANPPGPVYKIPGSYAVEAPVGSFTNIKVPGYTVELANVDGEAGRLQLKPKKKKKS